MNCLESMSVEITKSCNFKCKFCYASSNICSTNERYITDDMIQRVVSEAQKNNLKKITITGGEPLVKKELFLRVVKAFFNAGITINLNTNISLFDDEMCKIYKEYIGPEFYVFTSLLSPHEETCNSIIDIPDGYKSIVRGIECCKRNGIKVSLNFTISKDNSSDIFLIPDFVEKYHVDRVSISRVIPPTYNRDDEKNILTPDDVKLIADTLVDIHSRFNIPVTSSHPLPLCVIGKDSKYDVIEGTVCRTGVNYCAVNLVTGEVIACSQENKSYGNIYETSLYDCWKKMSKGRKYYNLADKCINCPLLSRCGGECKWSVCTIC